MGSANCPHLSESHFRGALQSIFADIPVKARGEWENYPAERAAQVRTFDNEIEKAEHEIDKSFFATSFLHRSHITPPSCLSRSEAASFPPQQQTRHRILRGRGGAHAKTDPGSDCAVLLPTSAAR